MVTRTIGATSIRIARTNRSPKTATLGAASGQTSASSNPRTRPQSTRFHSGLANQRRIIARPPVGSDGVDDMESEARRVGKECVETCRTRWCHYHSHKTQHTIPVHKYKTTNLAI